MSDLPQYVNPYEQALSTNNNASKARGRTKTGDFSGVETPLKPGKPRSGDKDTDRDYYYEHKRGKHDEDDDSDHCDDNEDEDQDEDEDEESEQGSFADYQLDEDDEEEYDEETSSDESDVGGSVSVTSP